MVDPQVYPTIRRLRSHHQKDGQKGNEITKISTQKIRIIGKIWFVSKFVDIFFFKYSNSHSYLYMYTRKPKLRKENIMERNKQYEILHVSIILGRIFYLLY